MDNNMPYELHTSPFEDEIDSLCKDDATAFAHSLHSSDRVNVEIPQKLQSFLSNLILTYRLIESEEGELQTEILPYFKTQKTGDTIYSLSEVQAEIDALQAKDPVTVFLTDYCKIREARIWGDPNDCHDAEYDESTTSEDYYIDLEEILTQKGYFGISEEYKKDIIRTMGESYLTNLETKEYELEV